MASDHIITVGATPNALKLIALDILVVSGACMFGYTFMRYLAGSFSFWFVLAALFFWSAMAVL